MAAAARVTSRSRGCVLHSALRRRLRKLLSTWFREDGLRPDGITASETPILFRLETRVHFENSHSVFPTVTRVNSASAFNGMQPAPTASWASDLYSAVDPVNASATTTFLPLLKLGELTDGRIVLTPSIAELQRIAIVTLR